MQCRNMGKNNNSVSSTLIDHVYTNYPDKYGAIYTYDAIC